MRARLGSTEAQAIDLRFCLSELMLRSLLPMPLNHARFLPRTSGSRSSSVLIAATLLACTV